MGFAERAVESCDRDWSSGMVDENHIRDVLKSKQADVTVLEKFLGSEYSHEVRWSAARVLSEKGRIKEVVQAALLSKDRESLLGLLGVLGKNNAGLEELESLIASQDTMVRDAAVDMFRRAGNVGALFPLIFNEDDAVVRRIKRYLNEA